jgi:hypothetical protein
MAWALAVPEWVVPPHAEIADLMWVAYRLHAERGTQWSSGVLTAAAWVRGGSPAPVTQRGEVPVTRELATAELWAAVVASERGSAIPRPPVEQTCADLRVSWREPPEVDVDYAIGAWRTLRWLLGVASQRVPIPVPVRNPDGTILTAEQLFEQVVAADPYRYRLPEQQRELRQWAMTEARQYRQLEQLIVSTQRRLADELRAHGGVSV